MPQLQFSLKLARSLPEGRSFSACLGRVVVAHRDDGNRHRVLPWWLSSSSMGNRACEILTVQMVAGSSSPGIAPSRATWCKCLLFPPGNIFWADFEHF